MEGLGISEFGVGGNAVLGAGLCGGGMESRLDERLLLAGLVCELTVLVLCQDAPLSLLEKGCIAETTLCDGLIWELVDV